ncbi:MAG: 2Fe-2S iron-sulfur cluster binding domain-containing protein [Ruminococcaceae bacterium]|nr:2Fe-2S iron-sulfur cluster binding domain-containing protein [Oscillospiraceae bacterium]
MENLVNIKINGFDYQVPAGITILEAAHKAGIEIPTLCYLKDINAIGACRICVVEVKGARSLVASCVFPVNEGMEIFTNTPKVIESRKTTLELILSTHKKECLSCVRSGNCELQKLCKDYGIEDANKFDGAFINYAIDDSATHMYRDNEKCILCRRCVAACEKLQGISVIGANARGFDTHIGSAFEYNLNDVACVSCGQCITACPTGALSERDDTAKVFDAINDPAKHVIVQTAPAVRVALGEEFGKEMGTIVTGKMVAALKMLGFDKVFDTNFTADLTIMEEATEFLERFEKKENLPLITSCSPGWIKFCEHYYPEFIPNLSSCKSPQGMFGSVAKTYYAEKMGIDPKDIFVVSVMPCTAKKFEAERLDHTAVKGLADIDASITVRELARMIKKAGINFNNIPDAEFDAPFGLGSGAGTIFGATGGVMEAALRTAYEVVTNKELPDFDAFKDVRGVEGVKEATYNLDGAEINVAVCSGLANAKTVLDMVKSGDKKYDFIEVMACPGGCVNGGGQPIVPASIKNFTDVRAARAAGLYNDDKNLKIRKSHENPDVKAVYDEYFGKPGSHKAHDILHTGYTERAKY